MEDRDYEAGLTSGRGALCALRGFGNVTLT